MRFRVISRKPREFVDFPGALKTLSPNWKYLFLRETTFPSGKFGIAGRVEIFPTDKRAGFKSEDRNGRGCETTTRSMTQAALSFSSREKTGKK